MPVSSLVLMLELFVKMNQVLRGAAPPGNVLEYANFILRRLVIPPNASDDFNGIITSFLFVHYAG